MTDPVLLGILFDEEDIVAIDFKCKNCGHSFDEHKKINCDHGVFTKCNCKHFVLDQEQVDEGKKELITIEDMLFEHYKEAKRLNES